MGFYYKNGAIRDTIDADFLYEISEGALTRLEDGKIEIKDSIDIKSNEHISIENNEDIKFDFSKITFSEKHKGDINIPGTKFFKASIQFGDDTNKLVSSFITQKYSLIGSTYDDWVYFTHTYDFKENKGGSLILKFYSTAGDVATITIDFDIKFKSIYELGTEFEIISANINSKNSISYLLKHNATDSIIAANVKN